MLVLLWLVASDVLIRIHIKSVIMATSFIAHCSTSPPMTCWNCLQSDGHCTCLLPWLNAWHSNLTVVFSGTPFFFHCSLPLRRHLRGLSFVNTFLWKNVRGINAGPSFFQDLPMERKLLVSQAGRRGPLLVPFAPPALTHLPFGGAHVLAPPNFYCQLEHAFTA